ncbi:hypothetical protein RHS01_09348 [Rhizoctonia solani]|uniref:Uncharacterized protein n=1 Tax=Rhizoctonia solani TaxID=456999 RepID=A0A8H7LY04_9AGAM|nr:hypothetical protein RHS01_09348 [Rhizoctonia solani]
MPLQMKSSRKSTGGKAPREKLPPLPYGAKKAQLCGATSKAELAPLTDFPIDSLGTTSANHADLVCDEP